jgi:hypothetical protein
MLSALIIGAGVGFLVFQRFENPIYGLGAGLAVGLADYFVLSWVNSWRQKK